jgi:hypothetical protein
MLEAITKIFKKPVVQDNTNHFIGLPKKPAAVKQTMSEIIKEIHETFYTEQERLFENANEVHSLETEKQDLIDKRERLVAQGFKNTAEVKEADEEIKRISKLQAKNEENKRLQAAIRYFSFKYPNYRFITDESVDKICEKYNLVVGSVDLYEGTVPDVNLKHIEEFKVADEDVSWNRTVSDIMTSFTKVITPREAKMELDIKKAQEERMDRGVFWGHNSMYTSVRRTSLDIVAPKKDFKKESVRVKGNRVGLPEILDPIVLQPVFFDDKKYNLIVTAWGDEAADELVVNSIHN